MESEAKIVELIQKCLNLGGSPNENEARLAMEKAQFLLEKYNLSLREIEEAEGKSLYSNMMDFPIPLGNSQWKRYLVHYLARNNFCKIVISGKTTHLLGRRINVIAVLEMSTWIIPQLENIAWVETYTYDGPTPKLKYRNSLLWGAISRIDERLKEARGQRIQVNPDTKALVLDLRKETDTYSREQFPFLSKHNGSQSSFSSEAYDKGRGIGDKVSLTSSSGQFTTTKQLT